MTLLYVAKTLSNVTYLIRKRVRGILKPFSLTRFITFSNDGNLFYPIQYYGLIFINHKVHADLFHVFAFQGKSISIMLVVDLL